MKKSRLAIWACAVLPEHVHLVIARHTYKVEQIVRLLKGEATKQLAKESIHPQIDHGPWAVGHWKVFLDTEEAVDNAIRYVQENPVREGKPAQNWPFVTAFTGLDKGWVTYH